MTNPFLWLCLGVLGVGGMLNAQSAHAGVGRDRATGQAIWDAAVNGRTTTIGGSNGSMRIIGPAPAATAGTAAGSARVSGQGTVPVADKKVPGVGISGEVAKDAIVGGVTGCLTGGALGCALGVATPLALAYVANSGVRQNPSTGLPEKADTQNYCVGTGPCYWWSVSNVDAYKGRTQYNGCMLHASYLQSFGYETRNFSPVGTDQCFGEYRLSGASDWSSNTWALTKTARESDSPTWSPATEQEVRDALYKNDPPPGIVDELARHGNIVWPLGDPTRVTLTGPAEVTGPKKTTINPDGSKSVTQERTPLSYSGPSVTAGPTTKRTETFAPDGTPTGETTETTEPGTEAESSPEEAAPTDTPLGPIPTLYTPKFPDGMTGVWNTRKAELMSSPLLQLKDQLLPTVGDGGACPAWQLPVNVAWVDFGTYNVAPPCWIWDFGKVVIVLSAMFLARALIFGG